MTGTSRIIEALLAQRLGAASRAWLEGAEREIAAGASTERFVGLISLASRHAPRGAGAALAPDAQEIAAASAALEGWNPERWSVLDALRVKLVLARPDLAKPPAVEALEEGFRFADVGEQVALHRAIAHLQSGERFVWRAGEGCRSSLRVVFEAAACDTPFPFHRFDDRAWRQLAIKALFVEAPLWRVFGLDRRLDPELARMALDLAEERRSAGRPVQPELWLCLGAHGGERGRASIERELAGSNTLGRRAAAIALARAGAHSRLTELIPTERDAQVAATMREALKGMTSQAVFRELMR